MTDSSTSDRRVSESIILERSAEDLRTFSLQLGESSLLFVAYGTEGSEEELYCSTWSSRLSGVEAIEYFTSLADFGPEKAIVMYTKDEEAQISEDGSFEIATAGIDPEKVVLLRLEFSEFTLLWEIARAELDETDRVSIIAPINVTADQVGLESLLEATASEEIRAFTGKTVPAWEQARELSVVSD